MDSGRGSSPAGRRVVVAGAGPAGLMASGTAAQRGCKVILLDANGMAGKKLLITGKGRCNLCNDCDVDTCLKNIPTNPRFLYSALSHFPPSAAMAFFTGLGVPLKTERGGRVFPVSDKAGDIVDALTRWTSGLGVPVKKGRVTGLLVRDGAIYGVKTDNGDIPCEALVVATGGMSYPHTGATGDGYLLAAQA
ncbi:MAG: NAD(P)/FAD-dependent oxidoreductase, partial [Oscillospiraceae bacterium]|nr:NAD(P)/FAD-dependent oxidoreductase [Oscillospiraceae bacterium]